MLRLQPMPTLFPYTTLFRSLQEREQLPCRPGLEPVRRAVVLLVRSENLRRLPVRQARVRRLAEVGVLRDREDRKSTRLNSSHVKISYAVFCLKKKTEVPRSR